MSFLNINATNQPDPANPTPDRRGPSRQAYRFSERSRAASAYRDRVAPAKHRPCFHARRSCPDASPRFASPHNPNNKKKNNTNTNTTNTKDNTTQNNKKKNKKNTHTIATR